MAEQWYTIDQLPDLTLNKYSSLEGNGVDGVIEKHIAFLRQLNRAGIVSGLSFHLFYLYLKPEDRAKDMPGHRLNIFLLIRGEQDAMRNVSALIKASPLSKFFRFENKARQNGKEMPVSLDAFLAYKGIPKPQFSVCSFLTKTETLLPAGNGEGEDYYILREWEMSDDGRLYNMCNMMESLDQTALYRVDLYPVERSTSLREALRKPMNILRKRQDNRGTWSKHDYDGKDVLDNYEDLIERYDSSPHFISNIMVFANNREDAATILDAAGSESLLKGKYTISTFVSKFSPESFLSKNIEPLDNLRDGVVLRKGRPGLIVCKESAANINLNYLPTLFSLEEIAPFFRFPTLYDGEVIQLPKETAPASVDPNGSLFLGKDRNGYDVYYPLKLLPKHAFISGVPGSGKTNTMHHITSSLWKDHGIPFLVLEPAKQEYRALANDPDMKGLYLFSPNADMSFPLHINPFEMPKETMVAEHIRRLCSVFEGAFPLEPPMPFLLDIAIEAVYRELGWIPEHIYTGEEKAENGVSRKPLPTMSMLYRRLEQELKTTNYSDEVRGNLESALKVRIGSLLRREMGDVFDVPESTFAPEKWLEVPAIIELESMGTGPSNFLTLMLCSLIRETLKVDSKRENSSIQCVKNGNTFAFTIDKPVFLSEAETFTINADEFSVNSNNRPRPLCITSSSGNTTLIFDKEEPGVFTFCCNTMNYPGYYSLSDDGQKLSLYWGNKEIRHVIFIEEAHNLIGPESEEQTGADADPKCAATAFVVKMLAEVRALKEGIVIADQLPTVMAQEVLKNTGLKIGLRITSADDRALLGSTMAASALQLEEMATFSVGEALIFYEDLMRPFNMRIKEWWGEIEDEKRKALMTTPQNDEMLRNKLRQSPCYIDENMSSLEIICKKYYRMYSELVPRIKAANSRYHDISKLKVDIDNLTKYFESIELGMIVVPEDKQMEQYDRQDVMRRQLEILIADRSKEQKTVELISSVIGWTYTLERLKERRWKRFGAPEKHLLRAALLQAEFAETALRLYRNATAAVGLSKELKRLESSINNLILLEKQLNAALSSYVNKHGASALRE